ncbi:mucin-2-like isoform X2 [Artemia franciscana]|uniref:mucin-2-like isoform X2 n=1 Tax=Artemia franciscana TaxID=6661 RepID=UPI0032DB1994
MPIGRCIVTGCGTTGRNCKSLGLHMLRMPAEKISEWLHAINESDVLQSIPVDIIREKKRICSRHFAQNCFMAQDISNLRVCLKPNAIPSLFVRTATGSVVTETTDGTSNIVTPQPTSKVPEDAITTDSTTTVSTTITNSTTTTTSTIATSTTIEESNTALETSTPVPTTPTVAECKEKWRNLRTVSMPKMKSPPNGSGAKKKAYYLEDAMQFCLPLMKTSETPLSLGNLPLAPLCSDANEGVVDEESPHDNASNADFSHKVPSQTCQAVPKKATPPPTQYLSSRDGKTNFTSKNRTSAKADRSVAEYFKAKKAKLNANETETTSGKIDKQDSLKMFLLSLMPELEDLSNTQIKVFKRRVFSLIDEITSTSLNQPPMSIYRTIVSPQSDASHMSQMSSYSLETELYEHFPQNMSSPDDQNN